MDEQTNRGGGAATGERWLYWAWLLLVLTSAFYFFSDNEADNDLWVHVLVGRQILAEHAVPHTDTLSYTATGADWVDHEWLSQVGMAAVYDTMGSRGLWLSKLAIGLLTGLALWIAIARASPLASVRGAVMVIALAVLARGFAMRPQIFTYLSVAWMLVWLDAAVRPTWRSLLAVALWFALWANLHAGFVVGLGMLVLWAASRPLQWERWTFPLTAAAAACVNAYGPSLYAYVLEELRVPHPLTEWQAASLSDPALGAFFLLLVLVLLTLPFAREWRRRSWWLALLLIAAAMALRHQRHTPLFALFAAAPLADQVSALAARAQRRWRGGLSATAKGAIALGLVALATTQISSLTQRFLRHGYRVIYWADDYPVGAVRFLQAEGMRGNLALPLEWGGYVLWHTSRDIAVSIDGRFATLYPPRVVEDNFAFFRGEPGAAGTALLRDYDTTLVLQPRGAATAVSGNPAWHLRYRDEVAELYGRGEERIPATASGPRGWLRFP
jgi:hypothetical protein